MMNMTNTIRQDWTDGRIYFLNDDGDDDDDDDDDEHCSHYEKKTHVCIPRISFFSIYNFFA